MARRGRRNTEPEVAAEYESQPEVPGETGEPLDLTDEQRDALAEAEIEQDAAPEEGGVVEEIVDEPVPVSEDSEPAPEPDVPAQGAREIRKPIERVYANKDWEDPFSGLRVYHSASVCVQSGAHRDGDEAVLVVPVVD